MIGVFDVDINLVDSNNLSFVKKKIYERRFKWLFFKMNILNEK